MINLSPLAPSGFRLKTGRSFAPQTPAALGSAPGAHSSELWIGRVPACHRSYTSRRCAMRVTPIKLIPLELLASRRPRRVAQRLDLLDDTGQHAVRQRFEFLPRGRL
jgi:hypothetical protein